MAEMSCILHVLFSCEIRDGTFSGLWLTTNRDTSLKAQDETQRIYIPNLMETVLWDQLFKCTSQHGPNYFKVFPNLNLSLPMLLFISTGNISLPHRNTKD